ncbi:PTTG1 interacting protein b isoform X1 [Danio aesculapii]|uniref:PTTG1 interacting protein b isoform X1 n=1 Tax=Danio aesculapii TaxID=1142201 RepID=UPI0024C0C9FB|nr:PTTG1 interacting protein b isoform X1 [Danio aesculapii]
MIQTRTFLLSFVFFAFAFWVVVAQTTKSPVTNCTIKSNTTCEDCLKIVSCLWCISSQRCIDYPVNSVLPSHSVCPLSDARWGLCWMNFQILIITISVIAGVIVIAIFVCCFCCCKCENIGRSNRSEERMENQASLRKFRHEERKAEMKQRHDEMRLKYGLKKENQYSRFENS